MHRPLPQLRATACWNRGRNHSQRGTVSKLPAMHGCPLLTNVHGLGVQLTAVPDDPPDEVASMEVINDFHVGYVTGVATLTPMPSFSLTATGGDVV